MKMPEVYSGNRGSRVNMQEVYYYIGNRGSDLNMIVTQEVE